ncbi:serine hydrolase [Brunnivagina elsteri]|uniref:Serine hydrolase n=1 Tax=Brunnivagina elsteri CCALA 953 TaxID=987040 RepID=A0A2A2TAB0_9CYAN|nr:serine hydrolase [Calothrix elsteri]PAX45855.1 serine hydrolase [Calothrix elsteri CCALA 953]
MSDSGYKLTTSSRRKPVTRGQRVRSGQKTVENQGKATQKAQPGRTKVNPNALARVPVVKKRAIASSGSSLTASNSRGKIPPLNPNSTKVKSVKVRKQPLPRRKVASRKTRLKPMARNILYALRLLIVGVGLGAIVGTALSVLDPTTKLNPANPTETTITPNQSQSSQSPGNNSGLVLSQEISTLRTSIQSITAANPSLTPGVFIADLDNGSYVDFNGGAMFSAASTIKIPIIVAFFQDVDAGKIRLDETITSTKSAIATGSGDIQYKPAGTSYTALEVVTKMITISDNTATNMLIERLGGIETLNQRFRSWGLNTTTIRNILPDIEGTNTTSPKELANLIAVMTKGNLVSMQSRDRILDIMRRTVKDNLLPSGLGQGATIAHKTGEIGAILADAGLVDLPTGKRYIAAVIVQRPRNDAGAEKLISSISRAAYQQFSQGNVTPAANNTIPTNTIPTNTIPNNGIGNPGSTNPIQNPVISPPLSNTNTNQIPQTSYQAPMMNPVSGNSTFMAPIPNNTGNIAPTSVYQSPVVSPQYYYPYQR